MPTPLQKPSANKRPWKAKYKGRWYEVEEVEDQGDGNQNVYHLKGVGPIEKIEDLDMTGLAASFKGRVVAKYVLLAALLSGCQTIAPYQKEFLLHPLMQDKNTQSLTVTDKFEKLGTKGSYSAGSSCPTCGG